ncbi:MAG: dethiobiotin synthase [Spirochaetota bacterium]|nr:dethiobiotin synthase [Spirochaetota bacterium]
MSNGMFITGTDTDVGKTIVAAGFACAIKARGMDVGVMKPVATGAARIRDELISDDVRFLVESIKCVDEITNINPITLELPLSPLVASRLEKREIDIGKIREAYGMLCARHDYVVVEGIGGILVPILEDYYVTDLIRELDLPVIIVTRPSLGTINQTLLTVREAMRNGIEVRGVIISGYDEINAGIAERTNPEILKEISDIPLLGILPYDHEVDVSACKTGNIEELFIKNIDLDIILE